MDDEALLVLGFDPSPERHDENPASVAPIVALCRAGALAVIDLGRDTDVTGVLHMISERTKKPFGVQPGPHLAGAGEQFASLLPPQVTTIVIDASTAADLADRSALDAAVGSFAGRTVLVEVTSEEDAVRAIACGATGLIAKGCESGGRVGCTETFVLVQQTLELGVPVWARGGIGLHSAAGAVAMGARGVVLDSQLALVKESRLPSVTRSAIGGMDGSETRILGDHRVFTRPDLAVASRNANEDARVVAAQLGADLHTDLVAIGQDAAAAADLAERYATTGGVVQAVRHAIDDHLTTAATCAPLQPGGGIGTTHGIRYPIAQGPMTRVSDRAEFAAAVADHGGLPFLALALMRGPEVEALLLETAEQLGERPWGVGILGFVPPELRQEQLASIQRCRPPVALIAGGRPSQATPLEDAGIATYLHVPSPGLLERFVKEGARRFVFEGRECGGHVGPRASFPLWDAQVECLATVSDPENLHVLFAGGIHDARSAAAAAAIGAPLAARGAHLGVLMGTAYLFTMEACQTGAIGPSFQEAALSCAETVLLETSPGHATRCVNSDYVRTFADTKAKLEADQVSSKEIWAQLETLNLGRLRMASKGLVHGDGGLVAIDEDTQRREGMYMIGQVATLRNELTSIAALHEEVSSHSTERLRAAAVERRARDERSGGAPSRLDIAVVGMAAMFPGSTSADEFWSDVVGGVNSVSEVPPTRWLVDRYFDPDAVTVDAGKKTPSKWGGFLAEVGFDPLAFGIPPAALAAIEPIQLLSLTVASQALADAGYASRAFDRTRCSVVFGAESGNDLAGAYGLRAMLPHLFDQLPPELDEFLPNLTEDSFPGVLTNVIAGRIANRLDLGGLNLTVDAACAASLAALDAACKELTVGNSDMVLCGGADVHNGINDFLLFSSVHALSPTGQCRSFDAKADGIALGEGVACVVLKRLADAERDGDRVYAVIEGVAGSSDGRHLGLTAPRKEGQQLALRRAYAQAGRSPGDLGLVEAHGTGTVVGDRTEMATLTEIMQESRAEPGQCVLGSVKSNIGHTKCAAGLAGLIKTVGALYAGVLPPTVNLESPNEAYDAGTSPFRFLDSAQPWVGGRRLAGVSAFGFGGSNFHAVLAGYDGNAGPRFGVETWPAELFLFRAPSVDDALDQVAAVENLAGEIVAADPGGQRHRLRDLAATVDAGGSARVQVAVVASDFPDLADKLRRARDRARGDGVFVADTDENSAGTTGPSVGFLYPGQGSQRPGMLADLFVTFPGLRPVLTAGATWLPALYPGVGFTRDERESQGAALTDTRVAQPALGMCGVAMTELLAAVGVTPDATAGHSYGELVALATAGVFDTGALLELSAARGHAIVAAVGGDGADPGTMAAVSAPADVVDEAIRSRDDVVIANDNAPNQVVISGTRPGVESVVRELADAGVAAKVLNVHCAFHSPLLATASEQLAAALRTVPLAVPRIPVWTNTTAAPYPNDAEGIRSVLAGQVTRPVRFVDEIEAMYEAGIRVFVEAGPGRVLTQLVGKILGSRPHRAIATDVPGEHGVVRLLTALAELAVSGVDLRTDALFAGRTVAVDLATLPAPAPAWTIDGSLIRTSSGDVVAGSLRPANESPTVAVGAPPDSDRERTVLEHLRSLREIVATEREVMLRYLGAPASPDGLAHANGDGGASSLFEFAADVPTNGSAANSGGTAGSSANGSANGSAGDALESAGAAPADGATVRPSGAALGEVVLGIVADRTGYPTDMLDPELDLEADLSIDSIKRIEIIGELAERIGLGDGAGVDDDTIEELVQLKSIREIVGWIDDLDGAVGARAAPNGSARPAPASSDDTDVGGRPPGSATTLDLAPGDPPVIPDAATRYVVVPTDLSPPLTNRRILEGATIVLAVPDDDPSGLGVAMVAELEAGGATVQVVDVDGAPPNESQAGLLRSSDGLIWLGGLHPGAVGRPSSFDARAAFAWWQPALLGTASRFVAVVEGGGPLLASSRTPAPGLGHAGMVKALSREFTDRFVRVVHVERTADPAELARRLVDEYTDDERWPAQTSLDDEGRRTFEVVLDAAPWEEAGRIARVLQPGAVVLVTGGARGVTAQAALAIARLGRCQIELVGRSPWPTADEDRLTAGAPELSDVRRILIGSGRYSTPAAIEAECARLFREREMRASVSALEGLGSEVRYHQADTRDPDSLLGVVAGIEQRLGRLDLVVHGAGILDDRLVRDKTLEGFESVFATKVDAARALLEVTSPDTALVFFGSVSGVFGNRGQVDYAAANDALDELAEVAAAGSRPGRVVSIDWGPWAGRGMVSPELEREYARRGIGLIAAEEGTRALLDELDRRSRRGRVVVMRARPEAMAPEITGQSKRAREAILQ
ncbi:MAG TPA: SDR family NAD(P)-dependent oxidoreductase [Acidimicrobiales bacterium]|nr:SDR family NAD(P)-dependent oxidoreductase [Acidimicrobiales bacterium]